MWIVDRYAEVLSVLRDERFFAGYIEAGFREGAAAAFTVSNMTFDDRIFRNRSGEFDLISELARPWSREIAFTVTGLSGNQAEPLAADIFASAQNPFDSEYRRRSERATLELAGKFEGPLRSFWVQAFVALSQSLPAFLGNAWLTLLEQSVKTIISARDATEELLRYCGPSLAQFRTAVREVHLAGQRIEEGDRVALMLASANRDPKVFSDPNRLDLVRRPNPHLAFGAGVHSCIGAALIRAASTAAISYFVENLAHAELVDVEITEGFAIRSVTSLVVRI